MGSMVDMMMMFMMLGGGYLLYKKGVFDDLFKEGSGGGEGDVTPVGGGETGGETGGGDVTPVGGGETPYLDQKYGLAPTEQCKALGSSTKGVTCKCQKEGSLSFGLCTMPSGIKCAVNIASSKATEKQIKALKLEKCKMARRADVEAAVAASQTGGAKLAMAYFTNRITVA